MWTSRLTPPPYHESFPDDATFQPFYSLPSTLVVMLVDWLSRPSSPLLTLACTALQEAIKEGHKVKSCRSKWKEVRSLVESGQSRHLSDKVH